MLTCLLALVLTVALPDDMRQLEEIRRVYEANRDHLGACGTIRFLELEGKVQPDAAWLSEDLSNLSWKPVSRANGILEFASPAFRFEQLVNFEQQVKFEDHSALPEDIPSGHALSSLPVSCRAMSDGKVILIDHVFDLSDGRHSRRLRQTSLRRVVGPTDFPEMEFPLSLAVPSELRSDLGRLLKRLLEGNTDLTLASIRRDVLVSGRPTIELSFESETVSSWFKEKWGTVFWIDVERGAIPLRTRKLNLLTNRVTSQVDLEDIRWVSDRGWLPRRCTTWFLDDVDAEGHVGAGWLRRKELTEVDLAHRPGRSEFRLEFPEPIALFGARTDAAQIRRRVWDLDAIAAVAPPPPKPPPDPPADLLTRPIPPLPDEGPGVPSWLIDLIVIGSIVLGIAGLFIWQRRTPGPVHS